MNNFVILGLAFIDNFAIDFLGNVFAKILFDEIIRDFNLLDLLSNFMGRHGLEPTTR
jgi:hypothetical protein